MMKSIVTLLRPAQWMKNLFILLPLFFSGKMLNLEYCESVIWSVMAFTLAACSIYVINDLVDADADRQHPVKCQRPIASGAVNSLTAVALAACCFISSLLVSGLLVNMKVAMVVAVYYVLNVAYCLKLKQIAILDVLIVSLGFLLRLLVGSYATDVVLSQWIVLMTFLLALFLALGKRRDDVLIYEQHGIKARGNVHRYNLDYTNQAMSVMAAVTIVCYVMYTVSPEVTQRLHTSKLYLTTLFVVAGILRYMQMTFVYQQSCSPTRVLLHDAFIQLCVLGWAVSFAVIIYM